MPLGASQSLPHRSICSVAHASPLCSSRPKIRPTPNSIGHLKSDHAFCPHTNVIPRPIQHLGKTLHTPKGFPFIFCSFRENRFSGLEQSDHPPPTRSTPSGPFSHFVKPCFLTIPPSVLPHETPFWMPDVVCKSVFRHLLHMLHNSTSCVVSAHRTPISPSNVASSPSFLDTLATTSRQTLSVLTPLGHPCSSIVSVSHHLSHSRSQLSFRMSMTRQSTPLFPLCSLNFTTRCSTHSKELDERFFASKLP